MDGTTKDIIMRSMKIWQDGTVTFPTDEQMERIIELLESIREELNYIGAKI